MTESTLKIARCCPLVIQGFSNFFRLFQVIMANPVGGFLLDIQFGKSVFVVVFDIPTHEGK